LTGRRKLVFVSPGRTTNPEAQPPPAVSGPKAFKCPRGERHLDVDGRRPDKSSLLLSHFTQCL